MQIHRLCGRARAMAGCVALGISGSIHAGPPLVTDDTGIVAEGEWEFILSATGDLRDSADEFELPGFEASFGVAPEAQATVSLARIRLDEPGRDARSAFGSATFEFKRRLYQDERFALAVVPAYTFPVTRSATDRGIIDDVRAFELPLVGSWTVGDWEFTGQWAYGITSSGPNETFFGLSAGWGVSDAVTLLAELYNVNVLGEREDETNWTLGIDLAVSESSGLLLSVGGEADSDFGSADALDRAFFIGFRHETG